MVIKVLTLSVAAGRLGSGLTGGKDSPGGGLVEVPAWSSAFYPLYLRGVTGH